MHIRILHCSSRLGLVSFITLCLSFSLLKESYGQNPATGFPPFASFDNIGVDTINLANLNVHLEIPVVSKPGRGMSFNYRLGYDSSLWQVQSVYEQGVGYINSWQPMANWGWRGESEGSVGYITYSSDNNANGCSGDILYFNWTYVDSQGTAHPFPTLGVASPPCPNGPAQATSTASDGSGYTMTVNNTPALVSLYDSAGHLIAAPMFSVPVCCVTPSNTNGPGSITDPSGNVISTNGSSFTDTLGMNVLTVSGTNPAEYSYTGPQNTTEYVKVNYTSLTVATAFGCSGVNDYPPTSASLVSSIDMPDGSVYTFHYELGSNGYYTGRISEIVLPTGGNIQYTYSGVVCLDGTAAGLTRTTSDGAEWTYVRSGSEDTTDTKTDTAGNQTVYTFNGGLQTQAQYYEGSATGTPLKTVVTTYTGEPISQTSVSTSLNGSSSNKIVTTYDSYENVTSVSAYDFGATAPTTQIFTFYGQSWNGTSCAAYPSGVYIYNTPCYSHTENSSGTDVAKTQIIYSNTGHPTSIAKWTSGSSWLTSTATYNSNGTIATSKDVNSTQSTYGYQTCNKTSAYLSSVSSSGLTTSYTWDCNGGVLTNITDANSQSTILGYLSQGGTPDPFWRVNSVTDPLLNVTWNTYTPNTFESAMNFNGAISTNDTLTTLDGLGRSAFGQARQGQGSSIFDSTQTTYGWMSSTGTCVQQGPFTTGACTTQSMPYSGPAGQSAPTGTKVTTAQYDALGRPLTVTDGGGGTASYTYTQNDVLQSIGPTPTFQKQLQYDGLGRLTSVCEITSASGSGACNQSNPLNGFLTKYTYTYNSSGNLIVTVLQNDQPSPTGGTQTRTYTYDGLNRLISETNPEWGPGTANYTYDSDSTGACSGTYNGDLVKKVDNAGNVTCNTYDALHRKLTTTYPPSDPNPSPAKMFVYDTTTFSCAANSGYPSGSYVKGRLVEGFTVNSSGSKITDTAYCYSPRGEMSDEFELIPNSTTYYHTTASYWANGALSALNGVPQHTNGWTFGVDGEGRLNTAIDATTTTNLVTATTYYPTSSQTVVTLGSGDKDTYSYDGNTGRMSQYQFTIGTTPKNIIGAVNWNANWTLGSLTITDPYNSSDAQTCGYSYDNLARLAGVSCGPSNPPNGSIWGQTFTYDAFGNISKSGSINFGATYYPITNGNGNPTNNREQFVSTCVPVYDGNGNLTSDCTFSPSNAYAWDSDANLVGINLSGSNPISIIYDAFDRAVQEDKSGTYSEILYSPIGKTGLMANQTANNVFIPLPGGEQATYTNSTLRYRHSDWQGSARAESAATPPLVGDVAYAPFGEPYSPDPSSPMYLSFTGQQPDTTSTGQDTTPPGLYDFLFREYNPTQGRWISPDPSGLSAVDPTNPQSWNRYAYVVNNPLSYVDLLGLCYFYCRQIADGGGQDYAFTEMDAEDLANFINQAGLYPGPAGPGGFNCDGPSCWYSATPSLDFLFLQPTNSSNAANNGPTAPVVLNNPCSVQGRALPPGAYVTQGQQANGSTVNFALDVAMGWPKGNYLDAQPLASGNVFQNQAYGNYVFGVYMSAEGATLNGTLSGASAFSLASGAYFTYTKNGYQMDPNYPLLPAANVGNITNGYNAQKNGTVCHN